MRPWRLSDVVHELTAAGEVQALKPHGHRPITKFIAVARSSSDNAGSLCFQVYWA
jgi:hypothetical protein